MSNDVNNLVWKKSMTNESESDDDVWDDTALIQAYDRAVKKVNCAIEKYEIESDNGLTKDKKQSQKNQCNNPVKDARKWRVGQHCRAIYSDDGIEYDAQITAINLNNDTCVVQYVGYGNEEEKSMRDIKPKFTCRPHADESDTDNHDNDHHDIDDPSSSAREKVPMKKTGVKKRNPVYCNETPPWFAQPGNYPGKHRPMPSAIPPPVPPPSAPFMSDSSFPNEEESLASMLMSWYMSGYHTGYYRALKQSRVNCNCHH